MNINIVKAYLKEYKRNFQKIHHQEIYKWKAIKQFQQYFDIEAPDLHENLELSLREASNLLDSGNYFPKRMLLKNTFETPEQIREMFKILFDEDFDIVERIESFKKDFQLINEQNFKGKKGYNDHRAILVYLNLMYPERYFLYKFTMFKDFAQKVDYPYTPMKGENENILHYLKLCSLIRYEIAQDQDLIRLHMNRIDESCYFDNYFTVLTQDFIYAVTEHLIISEEVTEPPLSVEIDFKSAESLLIEQESVNFTPRTTNYIQNEIENKRIGELGEIWVVEIEREFLSQHGKLDLANLVKHDSHDKGDGLGYDVQSFDLNGNKIYIEVKTTKGNKNTPFYITRNELERSIKEKSNYYLYRVYDYDENTQSGKLLKIQGDMSSLCQIPLNYRVVLKRGE
jgi:hypothetical protein